MITQETAGKVWNCYREVAAAEKLLEDMAKTADEYRRDVRAETVRNAFGEHCRLQLGVPSGDSAHRILDVSPALAKIVIESHIHDKKSELAALNELVKAEVSSCHPSA